MTGTPASPFLRVLKRDLLSPPPVWLMRQAGRYLPEYREIREKAGDFLTLCLTPDLARQVTLQPVERFGLDAAILFADILLIPHAMGQPLEYREGEGPVLEPVRDRAGIDALANDSAAHLSPVYETVAAVRAALPAEKAVIGFAGAPWTVAAYMAEGRGGRGFNTAKRWAFSDPEGFVALIDKVTDATAAYLSEQIRAGADAVQIFDSWAGFLPSAGFRQWVIQPTRRIVAALAERHPEVPVIGFPRGAGGLYAEYAKETGVTAISLDEAVDPAWARSVLPEETVIQGNLDPQWVVVGGNGMRAAAQEIVNQFSDRPHIFNLGHGLVPETPPEHVAELCAAVREAGS